MMDVKIHNLTINKAYLKQNSLFNFWLNDAKNIAM